MSTWISVDSQLPRNGQAILVKGIPSGMHDILIAKIRYWDNVGLIKNITHWKPVGDK